MRSQQEHPVKFVFTFAVFVAGPLLAANDAQQIPPAHAGVAYGPHPRNVLDFWKAEGEGPRPLLVYIHGGGWTAGDKQQDTKHYQPFLERGISCAAINYRLTPQSPLPAPVHDAARAIQFLRTKAAEWNIDTQHIALTGGSAGACTSMWLLLHDDLADPQATDPVLRESTRVCAAAVSAGQTSIDPKVAEAWLGPNVLKHRMINMAVGEATMEGALQNYEKYKPLFTEFSPYNHVDGKDPPLLMTYPGDMTLPSKDAGHGIHHPVYGVKLKEKADKVGHECHLLIPDVSKSEKYASDNEFLFDKLLPSSSNDWKAGIAKAVITPEKAVWLAGYGTKRAPDGKLHDLWMKALALEDADGKRAVLITSDFQGVPKMMSDQVFAQIRKKFGLERQHVMFTFSHNHCGPRLGDDLVDYYPIEAEQVQFVEEYTAVMVTRTVDMIGEALSKLAPATLAISEGKATFAVNRRNNREADVPSLLENGTPLLGPVDHTVPVMTVTRPDGAMAAVLFGYACHPTTLNWLTWCGDYPGFAQLELEQNHPGTVAMFVNTCGGDQNPLPRRSVELCQKYGHELAVGVEEALKHPQKPVSSGLRTAFELIDLPYLHVVTREELDTFTKDANAVRARWAARMLQKLDAGEKFAASYPYPVHAWQLGKELLWIGQGAETVVDYSLRFKSEFGPGAWVLGYVDDMISYIPSRRVWEEGGYEGGSNLYEYGRPALRWAGDVEDRIASTVRKLVKQVRE
jgi:acetyl esterase/lipase